MDEALARLHFARSPRIILGLRQGEQVPAWVTHILDVRDGTASSRNLLDPPGLSPSHPRVKFVEKKLPVTPTKVGDVVVDMKDVNVTYETRKVANYIIIKKLFLMDPSDVRFSRTLPGK